MQHARQRDPQTPPLAPRKRARLRTAGPQDAPGGPSPARDLQAVLLTAYAEPAPSPDPAVPAWPGWAKLGVLAAGAALTWAGVIVAARALL